MKAIDICRDRFRDEARAICAERDMPPESVEKVRASLIHRACVDECAPFMKHITSIYALAMPTYILHADGRLETGDGLTDELREIVVECRAHIAQIHHRYASLQR